MDACQHPVALPSLRERTRAFTLASLATAHPTDEVADLFAALRPDLAAHAGLRPFLELLGGGADAVRGRYLGLFDHGRGRVPLYETEYGRMRGLSKGHDLADVVGFYRAFGFDLAGEEDVEMPDHLAVELEFYGLLLHKSELLEAAADLEGQQVVLDARRKFLSEHLGCFVGAIAARPGVAEDPVYGPLLAWCATLVSAECAQLSVSPAPLDFFAIDEDEVVANCGGTVAVDPLELVPMPRRRPPGGGLGSGGWPGR